MTMIGRSMSRSGSSMGLGLSAVVEVAEDHIPSSSGQPSSLEEALNHIELLQARLQHVEAERRKCLESSRNIRGAVRVIARVRPPLSAEEDEDSCLRVISRTQLEVIEQNRADLSTPKSRKSILDGNARRSPISARSPDAIPMSSRLSDATIKGASSKSFFFDQLMGAEVTDDEVFSSFMEDFSAAIDGEPVSILTYGASGSGKTHTMQNLLERLSSELEQQVQSLEKGGLRMELSAQCVEIYNEQVRDLLQPEQGMREGPMRLQSMPSSQSLHGASQKVFSKRESISQGMQQILKVGRNFRATTGTSIHGGSSRSHMVLSLTFTTIDTTTREIRKTGKLSFVDLAGNERVKKSEVEGAQLKEAQHINKSLSALADVVGAKERRMGHVPYRNSKLTHILQDSLEDPSARIAVIVCLPPAQSCLAETLNTLQFSMRLNSLALQSLQVAAQSGEEIRAEFRKKLDEKDRQIENSSEKIRERDIQLEQKDRELKEVKQMVARLTLQLQQVPKGGSVASSHTSVTGSEPVSPHSPSSRRAGQTPTPYQQAHNSHPASPSNRKPPGGRTEDPRESSASRKAPAGGRSEDPGECSSRESSRQGPSHQRVSSSGSTNGEAKRIPPSSRRPSDACDPRMREVESRKPISLTYTYSDNTKKPLQEKLEEMRIEAGVDEADWKSGVSIIDTWGDEVDIGYHVFKVQFPVNVRFRPTTAMASLGEPGMDSTKVLKGVPKINQPKEDGARDRSLSVHSNASHASNFSANGTSSRQRNTSPREYSVKMTSPERALNLVPSGNLPPPIDSPGCPIGGCYQEISSVVRFNTDGSDCSDEHEIKERLLAQVRLAQTQKNTKETIRVGSADPSKDRRGATPHTGSSKENVQNSTPTPGHALAGRGAPRGTSGSTERSNYQGRPSVASPRQEVHTPTKGYFPGHSPGPRGGGHGVLGSNGQLAAVSPQRSNAAVSPGMRPQSAQGGVPGRAGSNTPQQINSSPQRPGIGSSARIHSGSTPVRMPNSVPQTNPRVASRSPHHG